MEVLWFQHLQVKIAALVSSLHLPSTIQCCHSPSFQVRRAWLNFAGLGSSLETVCDSVLPYPELLYVYNQYHMYDAACSGWRLPTLKHSSFAFMCWPLENTLLNACFWTGNSCRFILRLASLLFSVFEFLQHGAIDVWTLVLRACPVLLMQSIRFYLILLWIT